MVYPPLLLKKKLNILFVFFKLCNYVYWYIGHFFSYLIPLIIKLTEVSKKECKIKLMVKRKVYFFEWPKEKCKFFYDQKRISPFFFFTLEASGMSAAAARCFAS
jgi:hypothetical protein